MKLDLYTLCISAQVTNCYTFAVKNLQQALIAFSQAGACLHDDQIVQKCKSNMVKMKSFVFIFTFMPILGFPCMTWLWLHASHTFSSRVLNFKTRTGERPSSWQSLNCHLSAIKENSILAVRFTATRGRQFMKKSWSRLSSLFFCSSCFLRSVPYTLYYTACIVWDSFELSSSSSSCLNHHYCLIDRIEQQNNQKCGIES